MATVCDRCIEESGLAEFIRHNADAHVCSYCGKAWKKPRALTFDKLIPHMRDRIEMEYEDPANSVGYETAEGGYQLASTDTWDLLDELGLGYDLSNQDLHSDLAQAMGMGLWVHKDPYSLTEEEARRMGWEEFADLVKHRVRYLMFPPTESKIPGIPVTDPEEIALLNEVVPDAGYRPKSEVTDPSDMLDELGELFKRHDLLFTLKAGTLLFRVRIHPPDKRPENTLAALGPPSAADARFSNRMSPAGVSMFYAAFDEETAVAETSVRRDGKPAERTTATFRVLKDMVLLDLVDLPGVPSIFDGDGANAERPALAFLSDFVEDVTKPIDKDGREHVEYVPSQVVTEYVRYRLGEKIGKAILGVRYPSARRHDGVGCVLFFSQEDLRDDGPLSHLDEPVIELLTERTKTVTIDTSPEPVVGVG